MGTAVSIISFESRRSTLSYLSPKEAQKKGTPLVAVNVKDIEEGRSISFCMFALLLLTSPSVLLLQHSFTNSSTSFFGLPTWTKVLAAL